MEEKIWKPKTELGMKVQNKEIKNIDEILNKGEKILEDQIVDNLIELETELLLVGQSKGKFGGGQRRVFRQTQKKTREGNKPRFTTMAVVGDRNGHIGLGYGKSKETVPAREKALRKAKLNIFTIRRGSGSWESQAEEPHSIPFEVEGKCGSVIIRLIPAPKGTGLCVEKECAKVLELAGIQDIWSKTFGQTKNKINLIQALESALKQLIKTKIHSQADKLYLLEGSEETHSNEIAGAPKGKLLSEKVVIEAPTEEELTAVDKIKKENKEPKKDTETKVSEQDQKSKASDVKEEPKQSKPKMKTITKKDKK